jgi:hypothetical protein
MGKRNEINGNDIVNGRQRQEIEGNEEKENNGCQRNVGSLELAGRAILLAIQDRIGVKKVDEGDKGKKTQQVDKKNFPDARIFHELKL